MHCSSLQGSPLHVLSCNATGDTRHDPTEAGNEHSPTWLSSNIDEESQGGDSEDEDSDDASGDSKRRKIGAALYTIHLQERHMLTRSAVEFIEERTTSLIRWSLLNVRSEVLDTLRSSGLDIDDQVPILEEIFDRESNQFEGIDTPWLKEQFIKQHFPYVVSTELHLLHAPKYRAENCVQELSHTLIKYSFIR